jgi:hypothetical protein
LELKQQIKDIAVCLSLANFLWLRAWSTALNPSNLFYFPPGASIAYFLSPAVCVLGTGLLFRLGLVLMRSAPRLRPLGAAAFVFLCALALNAVRNEIPALSLKELRQLAGTTGVTVATALGLMLTGWAFVSHRRRLVSVLRTALLALAPFFLVNVFQGAAAAAAEGRITQQQGPTHVSHPRPGPRVVVILFDGMDQETALGSAERSRLLPAFARFASESVHFSAVVAPPNRRTLNSLPTITLGKTVVRGDPLGRSDLWLRFADGTEGQWTGPANLFRIARGEGVDVFLSGWTIPYCRIFASDVSKCSWRPGIRRPDSIFEGLIRDVSTLRILVPGMFRLSSFLGWRTDKTPDRASLVNWHIDSYREVHRSAKIGVADLSSRLVFVHYPVPHEPVIFDRGLGSLSPTDGDDYLDNQILADNTLGELRSALEASNLWNDTAMVVLSDHAPKNQPGNRHPILMVKPAGSSASIQVAEEVPLARAFQLILGLLRGTTVTAEDVVTVVRDFH